MPEEPITTRSACERFIKARLEPAIRIGPGVVDTLLTRLTELGDQTVHKAQGLAKAADRTTILDRDLTEAFQTIVPSGDAGSLDPTIVFAQLDRMTTDQLAALVRKIQGWLASRPG